jgi:hypothetical protein
MIERLHPLVDPLAPMLPGGSEGFAVQLARVGAQDLAAERSTVSTLTRREPPSRHAAWTERTSPWSALEPASSTSATFCSAARALSASSSGPAVNLERGSARSSGEQRCSPVAGSRPWNIACTCSGEATPSRPAAVAAPPMNRPGDSPRPQRGPTTTQGLRSWPAARRQHAPADLHAACPSGRTSAYWLLCRRAILRATGVSLSAKRRAWPPPKRLHDGGRGSSRCRRCQRGQLQAPDFDLGSRRAGREYGG